MHSFDISKPGARAKNSTRNLVSLICLTFFATSLSLYGIACVVPQEKTFPLKVAVYKTSQASEYIDEGIQRWNEACGADVFVRHEWAQGIDSNDVIVMDTEVQDRQFTIATTATLGESHRVSVRPLCYEDGIDCFKTMTHELGHVLGLRDIEDPKEPSVMQPMIEMGTASPTNFDLVQIRVRFGRNVCPNSP